MSDYTFGEGKVSNYLTEGTTILGGPYREDYDIGDVTIKVVDIYKHNNLMVVADHINNLVMCFKDGGMVAIWNCYDLMNVGFDGKRGLVVSIGHDTTEQYWFDNGEFNQGHIR